MYEKGKRKMDEISKIAYGMLNSIWYPQQKKFSAQEIIRFMRGNGYPDVDEETSWLICICNLSDIFTGKRWRIAS